LRLAAADGQDSGLGNNCCGVRAGLNIVLGGRDYDGSHEGAGLPEAAGLPRPEGGTQSTFSSLVSVAYCSAQRWTTRRPYRVVRYHVLSMLRFSHNLDDRGR